MFAGPRQRALVLLRVLAGRFLSQRVPMDGQFQIGLPEGPGQGLVRQFPQKCRPFPVIFRSLQDAPLAQPLRNHMKDVIGFMRKLESLKLPP